MTSPKPMGPIERELRAHPGPEATEQEFFEWAWNLGGTPDAPGFGFHMCPFNAVSYVRVRIGKRRVGAPGRGITLHSSMGRIRDALSEAIEAASELGL